VNASTTTTAATVDLSDIDSKIENLRELFDQSSSSMKKKIDLAFDCCRKYPLTYSHKIKRVSAQIAAKEILGKQSILVINGSGISAASDILPFKGNIEFWAQK
jgi:hypothetical protein